MFVWIVHTISLLFFQDLVGQGNTFICVGLNPIYYQYTTSFVTLGFYVTIPICITSIFGYLNSRHLRMMRTQNHRSLSLISRQMISMALLQIIILVLFELPLGIVSTYILATANLITDRYRLAQEQVARSFVLTFSYGTIAVSSSDILVNINFLFSLIFFSVHSTLIVLHQKNMPKSV